MSQGPRTHFTTLNEVEKKSKLWLLGLGKGRCVLWVKGGSSRDAFRIKEIKKDHNQLVLHPEATSTAITQGMLGSFDLNGVSFFFKATLVSSTSEQVVIELKGDLFKAERRHNSRLLAYPTHQINALFKLPVSYQGGKVFDIRKKTNHTGLFKSFLRLVDVREDGSPIEGLSLRIQDLSSTGMSAFLAAVELDWFKVGDQFVDVILRIDGEELILPVIRIVYVVDHISGGEPQVKRFKVGFRFEEVPSPIQEKLTAKINAALIMADSNLEFEDFIK